MNRDAKLHPPSGRVERSEGRASTLPPRHEAGRPYLREGEFHRRQFFQSTAGLLGSVAANQLLEASTSKSNPPGVDGFPQLAAKAKQVIFLFQAGGPSQIDLLDHKPGLRKWHGVDLPKSVMGNAKFTGMVNGQTKFPVVASPWKFSQHGQNGAWISELFPEFSKVVDDVCIIHSMTSPQVDQHSINCTIAICMILRSKLESANTKWPLACRPAFPSWLT